MNENKRFNPVPGQVHSQAVLRQGSHEGGVVNLTLIAGGTGKSTTAARPHRSHPTGSPAFHLPAMLCQLTAGLRDMGLTPPSLLSTSGRSRQRLAASSATQKTVPEASQLTPWWGGTVSVLVDCLPTFTGTQGRVMAGRRTGHLHPHPHPQKRATRSVTPPPKGVQEGCARLAHLWTQDHRLRDKQVYDSGQRVRPNHGVPLPSTSPSSMRWG